MLGLLGRLLTRAAIGGVRLRPAVARFANLAVRAIPRRPALLGSLPRGLQRNGAPRQQHRSRRVGAGSLKVKSQRRGQGLLLCIVSTATSGERSRWCCVKQRQAGEQISTIRGMSVSRFFEKTSPKEASAAWTSLPLVGKSNSDSAASISAKDRAGLALRQPWLQLSQSRSRWNTKVDGRNMRSQKQQQDKAHKGTEYRLRLRDAPRTENRKLFALKNRPR
jgi:hypothetical protein